MSTKRKRSSTQNRERQTSNIFNENLEKFSFEHFTYINQIFGDGLVRIFIKELYYHLKIELKKTFGTAMTERNNPPKFHVVQCEGYNLQHHILLKNNNTIFYDSATNHQNINEDINDTLCQSYSLMSYFGIYIDTVKRGDSRRAILHKKINRQHNMIRMYKVIIHDAAFKEKLKEVRDGTWRIFTSDCDLHDCKKLNISGNIDHFVSNIDNVLNEWKEFGYMYFIGRGRPIMMSERKSNSNLIGGGILDSISSWSANIKNNAMNLWQKTTQKSNPPCDPQPCEPASSVDKLPLTRPDNDSLDSSDDDYQSDDNTSDDNDDFRAPDEQPLNPMPNRPAIDPMPNRPAIDPMPNRPAIDPMPNRPAIDPMPNRPAIDPMPNRPAQHVSVPYKPQPNPMFDIPPIQNPPNDFKNAPIGGARRNSRRGMKKMQIRRAPRTRHRKRTHRRVRN